jgi:hypothetical protein
LLVPRRELISGAQDDDDDAAFVTFVPPPRDLCLLAEASTPIPAPLLSASTAGATEGASRDFSSLEYMSIRVGKETTDSLKFYLRRLNVLGLSNREKGVKAEAVATRILQLGVTVAEVYAAYKEWASLKEGSQGLHRRGRSP